MQEKVSNKFNMKTFSDYHELYVQSDTFLLADLIQFIFILHLN